MHKTEIDGRSNMGEQVYAESTDDKDQVEETHDSEKDIFDLTRLRLSQHFDSIPGVKKALVTVPVRKPARQDFFRVHPGEGWHLETAVLEDALDRETYLVDPSFWPELQGEIIPKILYSAINRQGVLFLWPIRLPGEDGRQSEWSRSALEAAEIAKKKWIRMVANMSLGAYEIYEATGVIPEPEWPDVTFKEIVRIAFKERFINGLDHPMVRRLRGQL